MEFGYVRYFQKGFRHGSFYPSENSVKHDLAMLGNNGYAMHQKTPNSRVEKITLVNNQLVIKSN